jgi:U6 snRNA-associated Sm-like protein LSm8
VKQISNVTSAVREQCVFTSLLTLACAANSYKAKPLITEFGFTERICIITSDGRTLLGTLLSCDQLTNLVLSSTIERIIRPPDDPEPSSEVSHGLYLIRGDNVAVVGVVDEELDEEIEWEKVRGSVIGGIKHI